MERESFEREEVAELLNADFVSIKGLPFVCSFLTG